MREDPAPWMARHVSEYFVADVKSGFGRSERGYLGINSHLFFVQPSLTIFRLLVDVARSASFVPFTNTDQARDKRCLDQECARMALCCAYAPMTALRGGMTAARCRPNWIAGCDRERLPSAQGDAAASRQLAQEGADVRAAADRVRRERPVFVVSPLPRFVSLGRALIGGRPAGSRPGGRPTAPRRGRARPSRPLRRHLRPRAW